jgi:hypothetical protein
MKKKLLISLFAWALLAVKIAMKAAGFRSEKVAAPPGKREMLRAWG